MQSCSSCHFLILPFYCHSQKFKLLGSEPEFVYQVNTAPLTIFFWVQVSIRAAEGEVNK